ncbi:hypothetical protein BO70DRAFT_273915, partial [Aspergillus heteromorphus CBS 117.55]
KQVNSCRRGSEADYNIRAPRNLYIDQRCAHSYYDRNFINSAKGLFSSLAFGDSREPKV